MLMPDYYVQDEDSEEEAAESTSDSDTEADEDGCPHGNSYLSFDDEMQLERKSRLPSLCSASADGMGDKPQMKSDDGNEELFYDPLADEADEEWIERKRNEYLCPGDSGPCTSSDKLSGEGIKKTDAVLNCPSCMTLLCLDCQRHQDYKTQYRAMFVQNCAPDFGQELAVPHSQDVKQGGQRRRRKKNKGMTETEKSDGISCESTKGAASVNTKYYGVKCDVCRTQVAVYDQDEVYHFFNVLASHS